jgi:hypothetical protein
MSALLFYFDLRMFDQGSSQSCTYRTILPWMAQETQYCNLRYILGTVYSGNTEASEISPVKLNVSIFSKYRKQPSILPAICHIRKVDLRIAADSTILRMVNLFIALSLGVHREQLEHLIGLTWPRPFLLRPLWSQYQLRWRLYQKSLEGQDCTWTRASWPFLLILWYLVSLTHSVDLNFEVESLTDLIWLLKSVIVSRSEALIPEI